MNFDSAAFYPSEYWDQDAAPDDIDADDEVKPKGTPQAAGENGIGNGQSDVATLIGQLTGDTGQGKVVIRRAGPSTGGVGSLTGPK